MSDHAPDTKNTPTDIPQSDAVDQSRRKLTVAALGAGAVFTLASRPVWANQCTISGMASGNLSAPGGVTCAGCTPGYWKVPPHLGSWAATGYNPVDIKDFKGDIVENADTFNEVFGVTEYVKHDGTAYTLLEVLLLNGNNDPIFPKLGAHAVAALLNASSSINYGYTSGEIITLFMNNKSTPEALKNAFDDLNNRGCPLGSDPDNRKLS